MRKGLPLSLQAPIKWSALFSLLTLLSLSLWNCQNTDSNAPGKLLITLEPDSTYLGFGKLWVGFTDSNGTDTTVLFSGALTSFDQLKKIPIPNGIEGILHIVIIGYKTGNTNPIYLEERDFDTRTGKLLREPTRTRFGKPTLVRILAADTLLSIRDTLALIAVVSDSDGAILSYAWDFFGKGSFGPAFALDKAADTLRAAQVYPDSGGFLVVLQVVDDNRLKTRDSLRVRVELDPPSAQAGQDREAPAGDSVLLQGKGEDGLGTIVRLEWKVGEGGFVTAASGEIKVEAQGGEPMRCILRVTDDDGLTAVDTAFVKGIATASSTLLAFLALPAAKLSPPFDRNVPSYSATVGYSVSNLEVRLRPVDPEALVSVAGRDLAPGDTLMEVSLRVGPNTIPILVTAKTGKEQKKYELLVTRSLNADAALKNLVVSPGSLNPVFNPDSLVYQVTLENPQSSLTVTPSALDNLNARILVGETPVPTGTSLAGIPIAVGKDTLYVAVIAQDGISARNYVIHVTRLPSLDATLANLVASIGALKPVFSAKTLSYTDTLPNAVTGIAFKPTASSPVAAIHLAGKTVPSGVFSDSLPLTVGDNAFSLVVVAEGGDSGTYQIKVRRKSANADLAGLTVSRGILRPAFAAGIAAYSDTVATDVDTLTVTASAADAAVRSVKIQDFATATRTASLKVNLVPGPNAIPILVAAEDGNTKSYTLTVTRQKSGDATLAKLEPSVGTLVPAFVPATRQYAMTLPFATTSLAFKPTANGAAAAISLAAKAIPSGSFSDTLSLAVGDNTFSFKVTAENGDSLVYQIKVRRRSNNAELASLKVSQGTLNPAFTPARTRFSDSVAVNVDSLIISAKTAHAGVQSLKIHTTTVATDTASVKVPLVGGSNTFLITVKAEDGNEKVDTLIVNRSRGFIKSFGGTGTETGWSVQQTKDGGFILCGTVETAPGIGDIYLAKTDGAGVMQAGWPKSIGGAGDQRGYSVLQTSDGGYMVAGYGAGNLEDVYLVRTDASGTVSSGWPKLYDFPSDEYASSIQPTSDGGFIVGGTITGPDALDGRDVYLLKINASGAAASGWPKIINQSESQGGDDLKVTRDGGYILIGSSIEDAMLVKTNAAGVVQTGWPRTYNVGGEEIGASVQQTGDGGYVLTGTVIPSGAGAMEMFVIKTDTAGLAQTGWPKRYGGTVGVLGAEVLQTADGGYFLAGESGPGDVYLTRINGSGTVMTGWPKTFGGTGRERPLAAQPTADGGFIIIGDTAPSGGSADIYLIRTDAQGNAN